MSLLSQLASSLQRKDEGPNIALAERIVAAQDTDGLTELISLLSAKKDVAYDAIKVLYEVGAKMPSLLKPHLPVFIALLKHKDNRLQWGAMTALDTVTSEEPETIFQQLPLLLAAAESGSVITKDRCVSILVKLCASPSYLPAVFPILMEQLLTSPNNQFPMYAEMALPIVDASHKALFIQTLQTRLPDISPDSKKNRVEKVLKKTTTR